MAFRGLKNLHVIYEALEDGSEILFEEHQAVSEAELKKMIRPRHMLNVFMSDPIKTETSVGQEPAIDR